MRVVAVANKFRFQSRNIAGTENPQRTRPMVVKVFNVRMRLVIDGTKLQYWISSVLFHVIKYTKISNIIVRKRITS